MAAWEVPIVLAAAVMGANKWLDKQLKKIEEEDSRKKEAEKRYQVLADGVVPDLYQFYQEMDGVIERLTSKNQEREFCENMDKLVQFMCACNEPEGVPTVQNLMMMAMSAKNSGMDCVGKEGFPPFGDILKDHLAGEIMRTSPNSQATKVAMAASAKIIDIMFQKKDNLSKLSTYLGRKLKGG